MNAHQRLLIQSGSVLVFRNDVAHRGTENNTDFTHYRLHCFIDASMFNEKGTVILLLMLFLLFNLQ